MMIKVNDEYLDFDGDIEIEAQIKLFDDIETMNGDYSYSFELSKTNHNLKVLGLPFPDTLKIIYRNVPCEIIDNTGFKIHRGSLRVKSMADVIQADFFGGNTEWFNALNAPMNELPLQKYDVNLTAANIMTSWTQTKGLVLPIFDSGALITRSYFNLKVEDFSAGFYVKTLFESIFAGQGIKLEGDLFKDGLYNSLICFANGKSMDDVINRSSYAHKTGPQTITGDDKVLFQDDSTQPYFDGSQNNFVSSTYTADVKMRVRLDLVMHVIAIAAAPVRIRVRRSGTTFKSYALTGLVVDDFFNKSIDIPLEAGQTVEVYADLNGSGSMSVLSGTMKVTPIYIYRVFGKSSVPQWTQLQFVSNIIRLFNALPSYDPNTKILTVDLFNKIKSKEPIDISDDIEIIDTDFTEFVSTYAKVNTFGYQEGSDEDLSKYNISNFISYGSGQLTVDNDFIQNQQEVVESDFTTPITYLNGVFDTSMERINFVELEEIDDHAITSVTDSSGTPRFNITNADSFFVVGDLVGIETNLDTYDGEWVIKTVTTTYIEVNGLTFDASTTGTATLLRHQFTSDNGVYLFANVPNVSNLVFSSVPTMLIDNTSFSSASLAYFNLLSNGRQINTKYKQGLSFGEVNNPLSYQMTLLETYWNNFSDILGDPVMQKANGYFHQNKFIELKKFLRPVRITTKDTNNLYYLNRNRGYKDKSTACYNELIKL